MRILIVTPAAAGSRSGNRVTAMRWARLLRQCGHRVSVATHFERQRPDLLIALHARRSHASMVQWRARYPSAPLVLALTGTDLYKDIHNDADAQQSLELADRFIVLQEAGVHEAPEQCHARIRVIVQSVRAPRGQFPHRRGVFEVCVLGHLREVKDPFRTAEAVRRLPAASKILVRQAGGALSPEMEARAQREIDENSRYRWLGELPRWRAMHLLARCRAMVLTSVMEGGANVVCEAIACGVPVISSRISGSIGLLGDDYPGYFPVGDSDGLAQQLQRLEEDARFRDDLLQRIQACRTMVLPATERRLLNDLVEEF
ncbi:MAG: selenoneine biosynthesis selenosugar synthase SenB [Candidatus Latescibacteria bacterium]|nr:TIGR04348 family glycosyltransferase [Gemmatimonadota bacterium]MDP7361418.1 selenoneine biosynthesis selenosugar synthase SenB [Candidatus Latescibacterota bacterium]MDP7447944.1 selenoneine biosynthesis selenosugar synthase SenB [Candidatus Latescibacterota bacterium]MDP7632672.1 selenoneine biosynthesis selenosugar synthase SenB [Candidatus Latescibacterota bacterium]HCV23512.1 TIGR04348 family glycosyltransferase [Candidatus Latescibacterota bacterium]